MSAFYVQQVDVVYGDSYNAIDGQDVNKGFGGQYVYLRPKWTQRRSEAASGFSLTTSVLEDYSGYDISKGDGLKYFRYIDTHHFLDNTDHRVVKEVYLSETKIGHTQTADLNKDRGGRFLYLCWDYA